MKHNEGTLLAEEGLEFFCSLRIAIKLYGLTNFLKMKIYSKFTIKDQLFWKWSSAKINDNYVYYSYTTYVWTEKLSLQFEFST